MTLFSRLSRASFAGLALAACSFCYAAPSSPPPTSVSMAAPMETTDWLIVNDALGFRGGLIYYCNPQKRSAFNPRCGLKDQLSMSPEQALAKLAPKDAQLTGFSPMISGYGLFTGMVLYYKKAP